MSVMSHRAAKCELHASFLIKMFCATPSVLILGCIVPVPRQALGECFTPTQIAPLVTIGAVLPFRGGTTHALAVRVCAVCAVRAVCKFRVAVKLHGTA